MKTLKKDIPVLIAAALFAVCGLLVLIPSTRIMTAFAYFLMAIVLLRRRKSFFPFFSILAISLLMAMRFVMLWLLHDSSGYEVILIQAISTTACLFTVGIVILFVFILLDGVDSWKKFRVFTGPLWFVPGVLMLLADLAGVVRIALIFAAYGGYFFSGVVVGLYSLTYFMIGPLEAVAVLLLSYWLYVRAPEDLGNYLKMREDSFITEADLEEHRRSLGLQKRKTRRTDTQQNPI